MTPEGITLNRVSVHLGGRPILSDISLELRESRIGIIGANGSGKTTFLRVMAGLIAPSAGEILVHGISPHTERKALLPLLGIMFQNPDHQILFPTVAEELTFGLTQMGLSQAEAAQKLRRALTNAGRTHWQDAAVITLSHGQKQWLCLQAILLMAPKTILLDEPFSGLDLATQIRLTRQLSNISQRLITISHDPAHLHDKERVIWLDDGKIRADGTPSEVLSAFIKDAISKGMCDADTDLSD